MLRTHASVEYESGFGIFPTLFGKLREDRVGIHMKYPNDPYVYRPRDIPGT